MAVERNLITYCNILQTFGIGSPEVAEFRQFYSGDEAFQRRSRILDNLLFAPGQPAGEIRTVSSMRDTHVIAE